MLFGRRRIGEILVSHGYITSEQLNEALAAQTSESGKKLGEKLIELKYVKEIDVVRALGLQFGMEVYEAFDLDQADMSLSKDYNYNVAMKEMIMPYQRRGNFVLTALADPLNLEGVDTIRVLTGCEPILVLAPAAAVKKLITGIFDKLGADLGQMADDLESQKPADEEEEAEKIEDILNRAASDDEGPIIQLMNKVFQQSMREHASDIHIEASEENVIFRFRVDGVLKEVARAPKRFHSAIIVRVKIMANLNIAEKRVPQDGRIRFKIAGRDIDVRVATAPAVHGERVTMRLLDQQAILRDLKDLGFNERHYHIITHAIAQPHGIVLVTGPTGSGKSTTLYACLNRINTPDKNILTVEDPVEYQLPGISQMPVNAKIGLTFASGLRSYLRHDPDVIMVGEIRDQETAEIAIQAALTGHLVFSTLHTNDAAGAFTRLIDMGVEPFLVSSSLELSMAQRLIRCLCPFCREPYVPTPEELAEIGITQAQVDSVGGLLYKPCGCKECNNSGYKGRTAIYEMMVINDAIRRLVMQRADASTIKNEAVKNGMTNLREDGIAKVLAGKSSIPEVLRVTQDTAD
ncbi:MAG: type II secretion system ATPase GspE [Proteobacteria bacterium]|nr:type II secretion system ATPase GspE [Pseudomonadota bacterium]